MFIYIYFKFEFYGIFVWVPLSLFTGGGRSLDSSEMSSFAQFFDDSFFFFFDIL